MVRQHCVPYLQEIATNFIDSFWSDAGIKEVDARNVSSLLHMASATRHLALSSQPIDLKFSFKCFSS